MVTQGGPRFEILDWREVFDVYSLHSVHEIEQLSVKVFNRQKPSHLSLYVAGLSCQ